MADWGSAVVARLEADQPFVDRVGSSIDWTVSPEGTPSPRVVLTTISDPRPDHFDGEEGFRQTRLQLDVYSTLSAGEASAVAEMAIGILKPEAEPLEPDGIRFDLAGVEGPVDSGEQKDTLYEYRSRVDFLLWHAQT